VKESAKAIEFTPSVLSALKSGALKSATEHEDNLKIARTDSTSHNADKGVGTYYRSVFWSIGETVVKTRLQGLAMTSAISGEGQSQKVGSTGRSGHTVDMIYKFLESVPALGANER
jgi:hypothetical protein